MKTLTVHTATGRFAVGTLLDNVAELAQFYRDSANEGAEKNTTLSNEQIIAVVGAVEGDSEDAELERIGMILNGDIPETSKGVVVAKPVNAARKELEAKSLAMLADNNAPLNETLVMVSDSKEFLAFSAYPLMKLLEAQFGAEVMATWPIIGARSHDEDKQPTGHPNPDCYRRPTKKKGGGTSTAMAYWSVAFASGLKPIRDEQAKIDAAVEAKLPDRQVEAIEAKCKPRIASAIAKVQLGIKLFQQLEQAKEYPACYIDWEQDKVSDFDAAGKPIINAKSGRTSFHYEVSKCEKPIYVVDADPELKGKDYWNYSIQQFTSLNFDMARVVFVLGDTTYVGGTIEALIATAKRDTEEPDGDGIAVVSIEDFESASASLLSFLNQPSNLKATAIELMKTDEDTDHKLLSLNGLLDKLLIIVSPHRKRIDDLEDKASKANRAA